MPGLKDRIIATLERNGFAERTQQDEIELPPDHPGTNTRPQIGPLQGQASNNDTELTVSPDHVRCSSPEPESEVPDNEEVLGSSQAPTSLFTSASDRDTIERAEWLEEEKEKKNLELVSDEPGSSYATPRRSSMVSKDVVDSSQETVGTPTAYIKSRHALISRTKRTGRKATSLNGSPSKRQPLGAAGLHGNSAHTTQSPTPGPSAPTNRLKRNGSALQEASSRPHRKPRYNFGEDEYVLPNSQEERDREHDRIFHPEAMANAASTSHHNEDSEEDQPQGFTSSSPEDLSSQGGRCYE